MLTDDERSQMAADAERMVELQAKAMSPPWEYGTIPNRRGTGVNTSFSSPGGYVLEVYGSDDADCKANIAFIAASRTDPSPANVLRLVEEVKRLRERLRLSAVNPTPEQLTAQRDAAEAELERVREQLNAERGVE